MGGERHCDAVSMTHQVDGVLRWGGTLRPVRAKKKRRKLRARRSKANHGRRPNAGRG